MLLSTLQLISSASFVRTSNNRISWFHHGPGRLCAKTHPCQSQMVRIPECHLYLHRDDSREFCNADGSTLVFSEADCKAECGLFQNYT